MAEPRKPRVIKTRPGTVPPTAPKIGGPTNGVPQKAAPAASRAENKAPENSQPENKVPGSGAAVRSTSAKVSVVPVPADEPAKGTAGKNKSGGRPAGEREPGADGAAKASRWKMPRRKPQPEAGSAKTAEAARPGSAAEPEQNLAPAETSAPKEKAVRFAVPGRARKLAREHAARESGPALPSTGRAADDPGRDSSAAGGEEGGAKVLAFPVPGYKRRRRNVLYAVAGVAAVLALIMGVALFSPALAVRTVVFDGQKLVGEGTLQLAVAPILSKPLAQVTDAEVQGLLSDVIQVKSSRIEARPPSTLLVHIVERVPVALLKNGETYLLVDQDGVQLGSTADPGSAALPLIDGGTAAIGQDTFRAMTAVLANLPQSILSQLANATAKSPEAVELALADGRSVIWGNASDMELKAQVLEALLTAPPPTAAPGKPVPAPAKVFDVSAPRHPVTR